MAHVWRRTSSFVRLLDQFVPAEQRDLFAVNMGARDGKFHDPVHPLFALGYGGIAMEGDSSMKETLQMNLREVNSSRRVYISWGFAAPADVVLRLKSMGAQSSFDVLKIDIDSIEADILSTVLSSFQPKVCMVEFNPDWPPPIQWAQRYDPGYSLRQFQKNPMMVGFYGASADTLFDIASAHGYALADLQLEGSEHNMWFVHQRWYGKPLPSWNDMVLAFWEENHAFTRSPIVAKRLTKTTQADAVFAPYCLHAQHPCPLRELAKLASRYGADIGSCPLRHAPFGMFYCASLWLKSTRSEGNATAVAPQWARAMARANAPAACRRKAASCQGYVIEGEVLFPH
jgi:hypothetical protein